MKILIAALLLAVPIFAIAERSSTFDKNESEALYYKMADSLPKISKKDIVSAVLSEYPYTNAPRYFSIEELINSDLHVGGFIPGAAVKTDMQRDYDALDKSIRDKSITVNSIIHSKVENSDLSYRTYISRLNTLLFLYGRSQCSKYDEYTVLRSGCVMFINDYISNQMNYLKKDANPIMTYFEVNPNYYR
ncbi:hypothetical protein [Aquitalea sp. ASV15]|uniref:hypothetical protein n=1 Tax=Aquitalea sp. ASV15 TaxID=2795104 RepID=UPI0018EAED5C|nr:hypothetical protein [Aquitalea sp. ASV15]